MDMFRKWRIGGESKKLHRLAIGFAEKFNLYATHRFILLPRQGI